MGVRAIREDVSAVATCGQEPMNFHACTSLEIDAVYFVAEKSYPGNPRQLIVSPPETDKVCPVTKDASSEQK